MVSFTSSFLMFKMIHCTGPGFNTKLDPGPRTLLQRTRLCKYGGKRKRETLQQGLQRRYSTLYNKPCYDCPTEDAKSWIRGCYTCTFSDQEGLFVKGKGLWYCMPYNIMCAQWVPTHRVNDVRETVESGSHHIFHMKVHSESCYGTLVMFVPVDHPLWWIFLSVFFLPQSMKAIWIHLLNPYKRY